MLTNKMLFAGCFLTVLISPSVNAADTPAGTDRNIRQSNSQTDERPDFRIRYGKSPIDTGTGSGSQSGGASGNNLQQGGGDGGSTKGGSANSDSAKGGPAGDGSTSRNSSTGGSTKGGTTGGGTSKGKGYSGGSIFDFFDSPGGSKGSANTFGGVKKERYATPEPGGSPELAIVGAGLALYALRRQRARAAK